MERYINGVLKKFKIENGTATSEYSPVKTKRWLVLRLMVGQRYTSKKRGHRPPEYTTDQLYDWCMSQQKFHDMYDLWVKSGYDKKLRPSTDRKDDYKGYSFDNIQLMTWGENDLKGKLDRKYGRNNKTNRAILQFKLSGEFVEEYFSIEEALRVTGISNISKAVNGLRKTSGGYVWKSK